MKHHFLLAVAIAQISYISSHKNQPENCYTLHLTKAFCSTLFTHSSALN